MNSRAPGATLVEIVVAALVGSMVLVAVHQTLAVQERSARHQRALIVAQQGARTALELLTAELREVSAAGGDLIETAPARLTFRASRKLGFVCAAVAHEGRIDVWQRGAPFEAGDSLFLFVDGDTATSTDDAWIIAEIASADEVGSGPGCPEWAIDEDDVLPIQRLVLRDGSIVSAVGRGSPVRSYDVLTYEIGQSGGDWMLGRTGDDGAFVPMVGPLAEGGVRFEYLDEDGVPFSPVDAAGRARVSRLRITVDALAPGAAGEGPVTNRLETQLYLRNR